MSFTKNLKLKKVQIIFLKFIILRSLIETSLRQFIMNFSNRNFMVLGAFLLPVMFYINFVENSQYKTIMSLIEQNIPGTLLSSNRISWETFQKTHYLPTANRMPEKLFNVKQSLNPTSTSRSKNLSREASRLLGQQIFQYSINSIDYWGDLLTFEFTKKWKSYKNQYFLGFKASNADKLVKNLAPQSLLFTSRDNTNSPFYACVLPSLPDIKQDSKNTYQRSYYQLDEFPFKLQNICQIKTVNTLEPNSTLAISQGFVLNQTSPTLSSKTKLAKPLSNFSPFLDSKGSFIGIRNNTAATPDRNRNVTSFNNQSSSFQNAIQFQTRLNNLENQFKNLFYRTGYIFPKEIFSQLYSLSSSGAKPLGSKFMATASNQILAFIEDHNTLQQLSLPLSEQKSLIFESGNLKPNTVLQPRKMSSFSYPDMNTRDLMELNRQNNYCATWPVFGLFSKQNISEKVKVYLGSHFTHPVEYSDNKPQPIALKLKYYPAKFEGLDGNVNYLGPVIVMDSTGNDYDSSGSSGSGSGGRYQALNWFKVRKNLQALFDSNDPRQLTQSHFFGNSFFNSFEGNAITDSKFKVAQNNQFYKQLIKRKDLSSERESFIQLVDVQSEYAVPYLTAQEWHAWLLSNKKNHSVSTKVPYIQSFPIRQISFVTNTNVNNLFDSLDYQNPAKGFTGLLGKPSVFNTSKISFHEYPFTQSAISADLIRKNYVNVSYFKRINQYQWLADIDNTNWFKSTSSSFYNSVQLNSFAKLETWEPLHSNSWLVVSQYAFAIFILYLLRQFALSYGRELVSYLIDLFSSLGIFDASFKDDLISENSRYRIINKPKTRFQNIAGIEQIFSQLSEVVWFLRNSKRFLDNGQNLPKGILLVGPPGTGKTLLVQAIAGEAQIPIFLQPAGAFNNAESLGAQRLQKLFEKSKQLAPCIIFFDEIDSIGQRRSHIIQNPAGSDSLFAIVSSNGNNGPQTREMSQRNAVPFTSKNLSSVKQAQLNETNQLNSSLQSNSSSQQQQNPDQLSLLMQLLIELDGLQSTKKVIVIGATNRVDVLDPALIRPGRFDKILQLGLPKKLKRIQICQLYAQILGTESKIYWEYIGNKTFGLSGADLATIMNQSSIDAILNDTKHTMQTIEVAIEKICGDSSESHLTKQLTSILYNDDPIQSNQSLIPVVRFGYYQAGATVMKLLLPEFQTPISCALFPTHENARYKKVANDFLTAQLQIARRHELRAQVMALYSGKLCEFLYFRKNLYGSNSHSLHSDFASEDLSKATNLIYQLVDKWYLYSHNFLAEKLLNFSSNQNQMEILDLKTEDFLSTVSENIEIQTVPIELMKYYNFQHWAGKSWWQIQVTKEESATNSVYANWYRIYLKNPDETLGNDEWVVPDKYYHTNETYFLTKTTHFMDLYLNKRDILYQTLLRSVLDETFTRFYNSTEFIDFFATVLIKNQYLRRFEIDYLYNQFSNF